MKKDEALEKLDRVGNEIHSMNASAWSTALNPTQHGWVRSVIAIASIPPLSAASIGHLVGSAVVRQINPDIIEKVTEFPKGKDSAK